MLCQTTPARRVTHPARPLAGGCQPNDTCTNGAPGFSQSNDCVMSASRASGSKFNRGRPETTAAIGRSIRITVPLASKALPRTTLAPGKRSRNRATNCTSRSMRISRCAAIPRSMSAAVTAPVPGPNSTIAPSEFGSTCAAMRRARLRLDGKIDATSRGLASAPARNKAPRRNGPVGVALMPANPARVTTPKGDRAIQELAR